MSSLANPTPAFKQQFHDAWIEALAQKESRFQSAVIDRGSISGTSFTINTLGTTEMEAVDGRYQDKHIGNLDSDVRVAYMSDFDRALAVDAFDIPKLAADPSYKYVGLLLDAANRRKDKTIYRALLDPVLRKTGENSFTQVALPNTQILAAGGTAFTKAKLIFAKSLFRANEADEYNGEELYIAFDDNMLRQILADTTLTSGDYMAVQMLQSGKVDGKWMGVNWVPYQALDVPAAGQRRTVMWAKSAVHYGTGIETKTSVGENTQKRGHPTEAYAWMSLGAGRQDEKKVVAIDFLTA